VPSVHWVPGGGIKRPGREGNCTPPYSAGIKNDWHCTSTSAGLNGVNRDDFTFTFPHLFRRRVKFGVWYLLGICEFRGIGGGKLYFHYGRKVNYFHTCTVNPCDTLTVKKAVVMSVYCMSEFMTSSCSGTASRSNRYSMGLIILHTCMRYLADSHIGSEF
jgi:hypothetical protein